MTQTGTNSILKKGAELLILIAILAFAKDAGAQCTSVLFYNSNEATCGDDIAFFINATPVTDSIVFDFGDGTTFWTNGISANHFFGPGEHTVMAVSYHNDGCTSTSSQTITVDGLEVTMPSDTVVCGISQLVLSGQITGTGAGQGYSYQWTPSTGLSGGFVHAPVVIENVTDQDYTLTVTELGTGCQDSATINVTYNQPVIATPSLCDGPYTIDLGAGATSYHWLSFTDTDGNTTNFNLPTTQQALTVNEPGVYSMYAIFPECGALTSQVTLAECINCLPPSGLNSYNFTPTTSTLSWYENGSATTWEVEVGPMGFTPTGVPTHTATWDNLNLTDLQPGSLYQFYVRSVCGSGGHSPWAGPSTIETAPACQAGIFSSPYHQDFETDPLDCWEFYSEESFDPGFRRSAARSHGGTFSYFHNDDDLPSVSTSWMVSPEILISSGDDLRFWFNHDFYGYYHPSLGAYSGVFISTGASNPITGGSDFVEITELDDESTDFTSEDTWNEYIYSLNQYVGQTVRVAFKYSGDFAHRLYVDDFSIEALVGNCSNTFTYNEIIGGCNEVETQFVGSADQIVVSWNWDFGDGSSSTYHSPSHVFQGGNYWVTLTTIDINGCEATSTQLVNSNGGFGVVAINDSTFCQTTGHLGGTVYGGSGQYSYQWFPDYGLSDPFALAPQVSVAHDQWYTLYVTDLQTGCTAVDSTLISVYAPVFGTYDLCDGPVTIDLGPGANAYYWQYYTDFSGNTTNLNYPETVQAITVNAPGEYVMYADFGACGALTSVVTVEECPDTCWSTFTYNMTGTACAEWVSFAASTSSNVDSLVFFFGDGNYFSTNGISAQNYYLPGTYTVEMVAHHTDGCTSSHFETITVGGGIEVDIFPGDYVACGGDIFLHASISGGSGNYGYQWFASTSTLNDPSVSNPILSEISEPTEVAVYITDGLSGCQVADTVMIYPDQPSSETIQLCEDSVYLYAPPFSMSYSWTYEDPQGNVTGVNDNSSILWVDEIGTYTCWTYSSGCGQIEHVFEVVPCNGSCALFFTHNETGQGCGSAVDFFLNYTPLVDSISVDFGDGSTQTYYGNNPTISHFYQWAGNYTVTMIGHHTDGCTSDQASVVSLEGGFTANIDPDGVVCQEQNISLSASINGGSGNYSYWWFTSSSTLSDPQSTTPVLAELTEETQIILNVVDLGNGCQYNDTTVLIPNLPVIETYELCFGNVILETPGGGTYYTWTFISTSGDTTDLGLGSNTMTANATGTYECAVYFSGCPIVVHEFTVLPCGGNCFTEISADLEYDGCGAWIDLYASQNLIMDSVVWDLGNGQTIVDDGTGPTVYYGSGNYIVVATAYFTNGCMYTATYGITLLTEVIAEIWEDTIACNGGLPLGVEVNGGGGQYEFQWSPASMMDDPNDQYPYMTVTESTLVAVEVTDTYTGCTVYDSVMVYANEAVNEVIELCQGVAVLELDPGSLIYQWTYTDELGNTSTLPDFTNTVEVDELGTYACITYSSGCNTITHLFTVVECESSDEVWPGDANSDNVVTAADALWVGLGFGQNGPVRPAATLNWVGQPATDWVFNFAANDVNLKHADCDGNGVINFDDTLAISLNYGLTHNKTEMELTGGEPELWIEAIPDTAGLDHALDIYVHLAKPNNMVDSIHGISFTLAWDESLTQNSTAQIDYDNSIFGTPGTDLLTFQKAFVDDGEIDIAASRLNGINIDGYGEVVHMRIVTIDNLSGMEHLPFWLEDLTAITSSEDPVALMFTPDTVVIDPGFTTIEDPDPYDALVVYPNPTKGDVTLANVEDITNIEVIDGLGRVVLRATNNGNDVVRLDLQALSSGLYRIRAVGENKLLHSGLKINH